MRILATDSVSWFGFNALQGWSVGGSPLNGGGLYPTKPLGVFPQVTLPKTTTKKLLSQKEFVSSTHQSFRANLAVKEDIG